MKKNLLIPLLAFSFLISLILINCTDKSTITEPEKLAASKLLKDNIKKLDLTKDTIITLPKSGVIMLVEKGFPIDKLKERDKWLSKNEISNEPIIEPQALPCNYYFITYWTLDNKYKAYNGKYMCIEPGANVDPATAHSQYGFTHALCDYYVASDYENDGYDHNNIYISLSPTNNYTQQQVEEFASHYNKFYVNEPVQRMANVQVNLHNWALWVGWHGGTLQFSDYYWPEWWSCPGSGADGETVNLMLSQNSNLYLMCDKYGQTLCGGPHEYWNKYKSYYGLNKFITSFLNTSDEFSEDWGDLLNVASAWGFNPIFVYGGDSNYLGLSHFCNTAWQTHWLLRYSRHVVERWVCLSPNPCINCDWPEGQWTLDYAYTSDSRWVEY